MSDLRNHLFETLEALKDEEKPMDLERARTVALVGQTIINSATVEVRALNATGAMSMTDFFEEPKQLEGPRPVQRKLGA